MSDPAARIEAQLAATGADHARRSAREWGVRLPSATRGGLAALVSLGERTVAVRAFVMRGPDRDHAAVYRRLLAKNLVARHWRFALDEHGDVHLAADLPLAGLGDDALDGLLGSLCALVDETYESIVRLGFEVPDGTEFRPPPGHD